MLSSDAIREALPVRQQNGERVFERMASAGRRRAAAKDPERYCAVHPALRFDDHFPHRRCELAPFSIYAGTKQSLVVLIALLVCLIPTTIGGLLSAIGIAGMDRVMQRNVLAMSGRAVEAAGPRCRHLSQGRLENCVPLVAAR